MKKLTSILLLALLLYNAFGYYILFAYEHRHARITALEHIPETNFQVLEYKMVDYANTADTDFEYVDKEITLEGKAYHIIKKRIHNGKVQLFYIPNTRQDELRGKLNDIVESTTISKQSDSPTPIKQLLKSFLKDYISNDIYVLVVSYPEKIREAAVMGNTSDEYALPPYIALHSPPPEVA